MNVCLVTLGNLSGTFDGTDHSLEPDHVVYNSQRHCELEQESFQLGKPPETTPRNSPTQFGEL